MGLVKIEFNSNLNVFEIYNLFKDKSNTILLDSSKEDKKLSKYSFIGINPFLKFEVKNETTYINGNIIEDILINFLATTFTLFIYFLFLLPEAIPILIVIPSPKP